MTDERTPELVEAPTISNEEQNALFQAARKILLFSLGVFVLTVEEINDMVGKMIERGEIAEQDGRKLMHEVMDRRKEEATQVSQKAKEKVVKPVESVKEQIAFPSRAEINALNEKIDQLSRQIDDLQTSGPA